jgi:Lrp/AsnC family transcriptional regulator, leucine-responsive regulatory protein
MQDSALSPTDLQILKLLQVDPRMSMADLAERTNSSVSPCWRRVKRLEESGVIEGYNLSLNRKALGLGIDAFVFVKITSHREQDAVEFEQALQVIDQVLSCYILSGVEDYLLRIVAPDLDSFATFSRKVLAALPHVREVRSAFVMHTIKETSLLPLLDDRHRA